VVSDWPGGVNLEIPVDDVDQIHANIVTAQRRIFLPLEERWHRQDNADAGVRQFVAMDPDGYMLRFSQALDERR
jgi:hypothetical protein